MIELLIDYLNREIKQRENAILNAIFVEFDTFKQVRAERSTLLQVLEQAEKLAAGDDKEEEGVD